MDILHITACVEQVRRHQNHVFSRNDIFDDTLHLNCVMTFILLESLRCQSCSYITIPGENGKS